MRVIIPLASGFEEIEAVTVIDVLRRGGVKVVTLSMDVRELNVEGAHKISFIADALWEDDQVASADMIVLPGGLDGMLALKADHRILDTIQGFHKQGKFVGAICAAPVVLYEAGILKGRKVACYPGMEASLPEARFQPGMAVVRDDTIITGSGPATAMAFALAVLEMLAGSTCRAKLAEDLLFVD